MKVFYDTEFLESGPTRPIELISIGMVADDGREYYAVNELAPWARIAADPWLMANVIPTLPQLADAPADLRRPNPCGVDLDHPSMRLPGRIATEVHAFIVGNTAPSRDPHPAELWAWYGAYDHVVLAQLFGRMIDLPRGIPMWTNDLRQEMHRLGDPAGGPMQECGVHNALEDARHLKARAEWLAQYVTEARKDAA